MDHVLAKWFVWLNATQPSHCFTQSLNQTINFTWKVMPLLSRFSSIVRRNETGIYIMFEYLLIFLITQNYEVNVTFKDEVPFPPYIQHLREAFLLVLRYTRADSRLLPHNLYSLMKSSPPFWYEAPRHRKEIKSPLKSMNGEVNNCLSLGRRNIKRHKLKRQYGRVKNGARAKA